MERLPRVSAWLLTRLLPYAEREEVLADFASEYAERRRANALTARVWVWRQVLRSLPPLFGRTVWRGWTGFEPRSSHMRPGGPMIETWMMDVRYSARRLTRRRTYALMAILTLALGAGGTAAIFSIVRAVLLAPLPVRDEARVTIFWNNGDWNENEFLYMRTRFSGFERVAAYRPQDATLEAPGQPLRLIRGSRPRLNSSTSLAPRRSSDVRFNQATTSLAVSVRRSSVIACGKTSEAIAPSSANNSRSAASRTRWSASCHQASGSRLLKPGCG